MSNKTITELPADDALQGTEEVPVWDAGTTKKTTVAAIAALAAGADIPYQNDPPANPADGDVWIDKDATAPSGSGGHVIQDEGTPLTARANLNFVGSGVVVTDDLANDATKVTVTVPSISGLLDETAHDALDHTGLTGIPSIAGLLNETTHDLLDHAGLTGIPTQYTNEMAQDAVGAAIAAGTQTGITVTYDDANNKIDFSVAAGTGGHIIQDEGSPLTQRSKLNFVGTGVTATDDLANDATVITIASLMAFPFYKAAGTLDTISLVGGTAMPFFKANGDQDNITLIPV